jgi:hypothetical protein
MKTSITVTHYTNSAARRYKVMVDIWKDNKLESTNHVMFDTFNYALDYVKDTILRIKDTYDYTPPCVGWVINPNPHMGGIDGVQVKVVNDIWDDAEMAVIKLWFG